MGGTPVSMTLFLWTDQKRQLSNTKNVNDEKNFQILKLNVEKTKLLFTGMAGEECNILIDRETGLRRAGKLSTGEPL